MDQATRAVFRQLVEEYYDEMVLMHEKHICERNLAATIAQFCKNAAVIHGDADYMAIARAFVPFHQFRELYGDIDKNALADDIPGWF